MPLSTEGLIEEMKRFRSDKVALVGLIGSMGNESEADALTRLRKIIAIANEQIVALRRLPLAERRGQHATEKLWHDVWELATEVEPWLAQIVARSTTDDSEASSPAPAPSGEAAPPPGADKTNLGASTARSSEGKACPDCDDGLLPGGYICPDCGGTAASESGEGA